MILKWAHGALALWAMATPLTAQTISSAQYIDPTTRYAHGILGDAIEWGGLYLTMQTGPDIKITLPQSRVFEDLAPRLVDLDNDQSPEIITVETDLSLGARLAIYDETGLVAATPFIGRTNRWLAPVGAADLDGDGAIEIAYIDRPHLAKTLRIWRFKDNELTFVQDVFDLTNHKIGWDTILGGLRTCSPNSPDLILADATWKNAMRISYSGKQFTKEKIAPLNRDRDLSKYLNCP